MNVPQLQSPTQSHSSPAIKAVQVLWRQISQALQKGLQNNSIYHPTNRLANKFANTVGVLVAMNDGKVWIVRRRCHHGLFGAFTTTIGALTRRPELVAVGSYWMWDDRKDWPWPMSKFSLR